MNQFQAHYGSKAEARASARAQDVETQESTLADARVSDTGDGSNITKQDIFYYVYAVLHSPVYRKKYEQNLKREFPRLPFYGDFFQWAKWGAELMDLHVNYETQTPFALGRNDLNLSAIKKSKKNQADNQPLFDEITGDSLPSGVLAQPFTAGTNDDSLSQPVSTGLYERSTSQNEKDVKTPLDNFSANADHAVNDVANKKSTSNYAVSGAADMNPGAENIFKNSLYQAHKSTEEPYIIKPVAKLRADNEAGTITIDSHTTLTGIPAPAWEYKLGNRSAVEWILDQYKEKTPQDATIRERFNTYKFADYKEQVIDLLKRVTTVSVKTIEIVSQMPED